MGKPTKFKEITFNNYTQEDFVISILANNAEVKNFKIIKMTSEKVDLNSLGIKQNADLVVKINDKVKLNDVRYQQNGESPVFDIVIIDGEILLDYKDPNPPKGHSANKIYFVNHSATVASFEIYKKENDKEIRVHETKTYSVGFGVTVDLNTLENVPVDTELILKANVRAGKDSTCPKNIIFTRRDSTAACELKGTTFKTWLNIIS